VCDDLQIGQLLRQSADLLDDFRRTTYRFGSRPVGVTRFSGRFSV